MTNIKNKFLKTDPPQITTPQQTDVSVRTGNDLEIKCQASGFPKPNITWRRLERTIGNQALVLKRIRTSDNGVYLCKAHNKAGKDIKEIIVDVISDTNDKLPKTSKGKYHISFTYILSQNLRITWLANGMTVLWSTYLLSTFLLTCLPTIPPT